MLGEDLMLELQEIPPPSLYNSSSDDLCRCLLPVSDKLLIKIPLLWLLGQLRYLGQRYEVA
jgi:hypothetical protein